jgi:hypothetical protein
MTDVKHRAAMDQGEKTDRQSPQDRRPGQPDASGGDPPRDGDERPSKRDQSRPETLPSATTSGGLPSEPGWMRS